MTRKTCAYCGLALLTCVVAAPCLAAELPAPVAELESPAASSQAAPSAAGETATRRLAEQKSEIERLRNTVEASQKETELLRQTVEASKEVTNLGATVMAVLLGILGLLIGVVGVLLPVYTYFATIRPADRTREEARRVLEGLDERFLELTKRHQQNEVEQAIEKLGSDDQALRANGAMYLSLNPYFQFTEKQLSEICRIAETADLTVMLQLLGAVCGRESPSVSRILADLLPRPQGGGLILGCVVKQANLPGGSELRTQLKKWLVSPEGRIQLTGALINAATVPVPWTASFSPPVLPGRPEG